MNQNERRCAYRLTIQCKFPETCWAEDTDKNCELCLAGQQIDSIELLTSAIMSFGIDALDKEVNK